ncbi:MAG: alkaline phosphatase family protein [Acidimicrobiales bacterium]
MERQNRIDRLSGRFRLRHRDRERDHEQLAEPGLAPGTDRVPEIRHVVLLMMENHSFDNYLGTLGRGDGLQHPLPTNPDSNGQLLRAHRMTTTRQAEGAPSQSWKASHIQYGEGVNGGFAQAVERLPGQHDPALAMGYWTADDLPFYHSLASTFPLADRWFCSCLGPTFPNRRFLVAATANGLIDDEMASVIDYPRSGTIFDLLNRHGISWANYHHVPHPHLYGKRAGGVGSLHVARRAQLLRRHLLPGVVKQVRGEIQCTANMYPLGLTRTVKHLRRIEQFFTDAAEGTLPAVSVVDPDFSRCSEENPQDIQRGEAFAAAVIDAVLHGKGWPHSLLIWLYDEHGGYYDHVPPPPAVEPDDVRPHSLLDGGAPIRWLLEHSGLGRSIVRRDDTSGAYDRLGFRVPAVVVSPYAKPDYVSSTVYDHTSALKLVEEKWNLPPLTRRDAAAVAPWDMIDLDAPPRYLDPPELEPPRRSGWS